MCKKIFINVGIFIDRLCKRKEGSCDVTPVKLTPDCLQAGADLFPPRAVVRVARVVLKSPF